MGLEPKHIYWQQIKEAQKQGIVIPMNKLFVNYTADELKNIVDKYISDSQDTAGLDVFAQAAAAVSQQEPPGFAASQPLPAPVATGYAAPERGREAGTQRETPPVRDWGKYPPQTLANLLGVPLNDQPSRRAGLTFNTHGPDDVLRVSSDGKVWYQDEVPKPAIPLPRMRRKVKYVNSGVKTIERRDAEGRLDESFEVAGDGHEEAEIKITTPSSQVGIYYDPRLPFRVHVYNGRRGFDYMDVIRYYGGADLVPTAVVTIYVGTDLCFDINKTRDAMEQELRDAQLRKR